MSTKLSRTKVELSTALGILCTLTLVAVAISMDGGAGAFVNIPSVLIVICGTFAITTACFTAVDVWRAQKLILRTIVYKHYDTSVVAEYMMELANKARKGSVLALQNVIASGHMDHFLERGLAMIIDGVPVERVEHLMQQDMYSLTDRHNRVVAVYRRAAEVAPAMGLVGTLIGLVQMLSRLSDPAAIGPAMAVALLTTFYGAIISYAVLSPLASKLERITNQELLVNQIYLEGILSIAKQENPRQLENVINSLLPPSKRIRYFI